MAGAGEGGRGVLHGKLVIGGTDGVGGNRGGAGGSGDSKGVGGGKRGGVEIVTFRGKQLSPASLGVREYRQQERMLEID